ncbi:hypothetical protein LEP1GSC195_2565 [Leptospira wolbachii serovar Codice str. CDC]|uniref:Uncharacterized protein n=1 Tax=Leptospira wolbachii serovar Codice str. CDC TaxID=1218599 RepID=R9A0U3_9LEPT|nr:hypothetical protein LEP1GSC195_2565 [Leptospira wolbachii serovar Codice str. CDC]
MVKRKFKRNQFWILFLYWMNPGVKFTFPLDPRVERVKHGR